MRGWGGVLHLTAKTELSVRNGMGVGGGGR